MRYAETGYNLEVDLSRGNIERVQTDPRLTELHLGGQGTAAKILWDRVPPEVDPLSPDNLLIFSAGLLGGTGIPGANRTMVNSINPQTNLQSHSIFGGFFSPELKHAGYDRIIIRGKADSLVYLWINNDKVEIRDASHLRGKGCLETAGLIQDELDDPRAQVASIGLAGENQVYAATIEHANSSASRGVGAVMGSKNLKAIAVRGTKDIYVAKPAELWQMCDRQYQEIHDNPDCGDVFTREDDESWHVDNFAWGNARERRKNLWTKQMEEDWGKTSASLRLRWTGCFNCPKDCHQVVQVPGHRIPVFQKCYSKLTYAMAAYEDLRFDYEMLALAQEYGLDGFSTPQLLAFGIELYEAGILTDADLPDFPDNNAQRFFYLLEKLVRREGVGDKLANGVYWAARQIGKGAEAYDHNTIKKMEQLPLKLAYVNYPYFLMYATGEKMTITQIEGSFPQIPEPDPEKRKELVERWEAAPERFKKWFLEWEPRTNPPLDASIHIADWNETLHYVDDAIGMCAFLSCFRGQFGMRPPYHLFNLPTYLSLATGMEMDPEKLWEIGRRNRNLVRAINVRRGLRRNDEKPPEDHWKKREPETEQQLLSDYYAYKGWTNDGVPTKETLDKLGLDYVSEDFIQRGILTGNETVSSELTYAQSDT